MLVTRTQLEGNNPLKTNVVIGQFESGDRLDFLERATTMQGFILECIIVAIKAVGLPADFIGRCCTRRYWNE